MVLERLIVAGVAITTRALAEATPGLDLTFPQWRTLLVVGESPDGATVSEVAARVGVTLPATSRQLRRLSDRGLIEIGPDEHDHRAARARLSTRGNVVRDAILRHRREQIAATAAGLQIEATALDALIRVADAFDVHR